MSCFPTSVISATISAFSSITERVARIKRYVCAGFHNFVQKIIGVKQSNKVPMTSATDNQVFSAPSVGKEVSKVQSLLKMEQFEVLADDIQGEMIDVSAWRMTSATLISDDIRREISAQQIKLAIKRQRTSL